MVDVVSTVIVKATFWVLAVGEIDARVTRTDDGVWISAYCLGDGSPGTHDYQDWSLLRKVGPNDRDLPPDELAEWTLGGEKFQWTPSEDDLPRNVQNALINAARAMLAWVS
jgi:hypothetical protein